MSRRAAILGLGSRGQRWARALKESGWATSGFDPEPLVRVKDARREETISSTVARADWVIVAVPDRLELIQSVVRRAQAEAPEPALLAVVSRAFDAEAVRGCTLRPAQVVLVSDTPGGVSLEVSSQTPPEVKVAALAFLSEVSDLVSPDTALEVAPYPDTVEGRGSA